MRVVTVPAAAFALSACAQAEARAAPEAPDVRAHAVKDETCAPAVAVRGVDAAVMRGKLTDRDALDAMRTGPDAARR